MHKGLKVFERAPTSQSVLNVVSTSNLKRVHSVEDNIEGAKIQRSDVFDDEEVKTMEELVVPETVHVAEEVTNEDILVEIKEATEQVMNSVNSLQKSNVTMEPINEDEIEQDGEDNFKQRLVGHSTVRPLDSWTQHCLTIGQLDTALSDHWTVQHGTVQPLDSSTQHCSTIGQLDTALSNHWTVGHGTV